MTIARNATAYRATGLTEEVLQIAVGNMPFFNCEKTSAASSGFIPPRPAAPDLRLHAAAGIFGFAFRIDTKILPGAVVNAAAQERAAQIEEDQGRKVGRKELRDIKEAIYLELLQVAFIKRTVLRGWFDSTANLFVVNTPSANKAELVTSAIFGGLKGTEHQVNFEPVSRGTAPNSHFSAWVATGEAPDHFSLDDKAVFTDAGGGKVRAAHVNVTKPEVQALSVGRVVTELAMTHDDKISFTVTDNLALKGIGLIGIDKINPAQSDLLPEELEDAELTITAGLVRNAVESLTGVMEM